MDPIVLLLLLLLGRKAPAPLRQWTIPVRDDEEGVAAVQEFERLGKVEHMSFDGRTLVLMWRPAGISHEKMHESFPGATVVGLR